MLTLGSNLSMQTHPVPRRLPTLLWHFSLPNAHALIPRTLCFGMGRLQPLCCGMRQYRRLEGDDGGDGGRNSQVARKRETKMELSRGLESVNW
ncbi:C-terminal binding protein AN-like [Pyrus ussuriensis x Pyrus communis]|uniref:C-terminal binding protein AN-like n=1 Tax=Pyrus ussuriensis x Pyrus communis TaxID=2448454 RepID=A0A5N5FJ43_9ROSA|nr:C-terminal binding protein AN-like [Pyrus ussuriensis x Pyrus communis]